MTGLDRNQTPKTRPMPQKRTALVASLDIGTSKIACMIARLKPCPPNEALRGRSHAVELIGYSQIQSRGVKAGAVVDLAECEQAVRQAVALAERMAKVRVESVLLSVSGGRLQGQLVRLPLISAAARSCQTMSPALPPPACVTPPARAAPCCTPCRSATRSTASRVSVIHAGWSRGSSAST